MFFALHFILKPHPHVPCSAHVSYEYARFVAPGVAR